MFRFKSLAEEIRIKEPVKYLFDPKDYPEYEHCKTGDDESAIEDYNNFATWKFFL